MCWYRVKLRCPRLCDTLCCGLQAPDFQGSRSSADRSPRGATAGSGIGDAGGRM